MLHRKWTAPGQLNRLALAISVCLATTTQAEEARQLPEMTVEGAEYLLENAVDWSERDVYYWYYATQVMHHAGGPEWKRWNLKLRDILVQTQEKGGHEAGSWDPNGPHAHAGGRIYMTALAVCTLEVYYRHAPIFRRLKLTVE